MTRDEWLASHSRDVEVIKQRALDQKAEEERILDACVEADAEIAAAAADPMYWRRKKLKAAIVDMIKQSDGPVHQSHLYRVLNGNRYMEAFQQALRELLEDQIIIQTSFRSGPKGRLGIAYVLAPQ